MSSIDRELIIHESQAGSRLDKLIASIWSDFSRSKLQQWMAEGHLQVNGQTTNGKYKVQAGDRCCLSVELIAVDEWQPEDMKLHVVYEDDAIIVLNKPAGLVVHPAAGNWSGTLVNGLLHNYPELEHLPRAGIVHRLDKETTGLMVVARTLQAHHSLVKALQAREISRRYLALVHHGAQQSAQNKGRERQFTVDAPIGRHPKNRLKMAVVNNGKPARTHFRVRETLDDFILFDVRLETGRTHQIRVHLAHCNMPIYGDPLYGPKPEQASGFAQLGWQRQALHARYLQLTHPVSGQVMAFEGRLPEDFSELLQTLGANSVQNNSVQNQESLQ